MGVMPKRRRKPRMKWFSLSDSSRAMVASALATTAVSPLARGLSAAEIMELLRKLNLSGKTIIMVTHEADIANWARRVVRMRDGLVESDVFNEHHTLRSAP